ncbi:MAG: glycosyltransferase [Chitinophagales bacterium]
MEIDLQASGNDRSQYKGRTLAFYNHFELLAQSYKRYKQKFSYYWKDIVRYCNYFIHEEDSVIEIGCGVGDSLNGYKGKKKVGIDFSPSMIEVAQANYPNLDFHLMDAANITLEEKFDVVILSNVIGYFDNIEDVLLELKKICHDRTKVIVSYYNHSWEPLINLAELIGLKKKSPVQNWLSQQDISNLLYLSGFETFKSKRRMIIPVWIPILSWFFNKYVANLPFFNRFGLSKFVFARRMAIKSSSDVAEKYSTTVVIPARNESGNIEDAILRLPKFGKHVEIIFVEGNSTDDTWEKIQAIQAKYKDTHDIKITQQEGKGKGDAVRKGYAMASGDILMILDADLTVPPEDIPKFYDALATGKGEFINGCRLIYPMESQAMRFLNTLGNKFFSKVFSWLLEQPIKDTLCGTKVMFRTDYNRLIANRAFFGEFDPFGDFDLLFGAYKLNLKIIDLPIRYRDRTYGDTNISRFKHGLLLLRMCWFASGKIKFW